MSNAFLLKIRQHVNDGAQNVEELLFLVVVGHLPAVVVDFAGESLVGFYLQRLLTQLLKYVDPPFFLFLDFLFHSTRFVV